MAWQYPQVFGYAACMSSTFSYQDDLIERVLSEPKSTAKFYLDSGWPGDNYEVTLAMAMAFVDRGYRVRGGLPAPRLPAGRSRRARLGQAPAPAPAAGAGLAGRRPERRDAQATDVTEGRWT